jgi:hypothetical protein
MLDALLETIGTLGILISLLQPRRPSSLDDRHASAYFSE